MDQTTRANLAPRCSHVHDGGHPCGSPALREHDFCYFHERLHHPPANPVKTPVAFIPPLESPEALQIAATNIARALCMGQLTDKQARNMNASLRMARWAIEQRAKSAAEGNQPDPITELPEGMEKVLTAAHTEPESEERAEGAPSLPSVAKGGMLNDGTTINAQVQTPEDTRPNRNYIRIHRGPLPRSGSAAHDDLIPIPDSWKARPLKDFPLGASLDDNLLQYVRFVIRVGHEHPEYDAAHRHLAAHIASGAASR
jgi:hypothetical protein